MYRMALLRSLASILLITHLVFGSELFNYLEQQVPQLNSNISHDHGLEPFHKPMTKCPPWKYHKDNNSDCVCGPGIGGIVECWDNHLTVLLLTCHCMSYSEIDDQVVMGACPFLCTNSFYTKIYADTNLSDLCNHDIRQYRQGQMCGQCKDNHSPSPYSYQLKCARCKNNYKYNWLKYLVMAYFPLTIFFVVVIIFKINALSASMNAFIFFCQITSCPAVMSLLSTFVYFSDKHPVDRDINIISLVEAMATVFGMWNLDFFRMVYKPFCLHLNMSIIQIMCLDYAVAVYPLLLIMLTYMFFKLHERFNVIQLCFKPLVWIVTRFNHQWKASNSLIEAFATFILLSYVKIINTSFDILMPVQVHNVSGQVVGLYTFYNGSLEYFGHDHLPYALLAMFMFITFNLVPFLLLCLYPCRCFQSCLNCCRLNSQVLRTFMDAFQGCYKFEPYDCRYWAAFYLFLRIAALAIFAVTQSGYFIVVGGITLIPVIVLAAVIRPYRETVYNVVDVVILLAFVQAFFSAAGISLCTFNRRFEGFVTLMLGIGIAVPLVYITVLAVYKILPKSCIVYLKICALRLPCADRLGFVREGDEEDPLLSHLEESVEHERTLLLHRNIPRYNGLLNDYTGSAQ